MIKSKIYTEEQVNKMLRTSNAIYGLDDVFGELQQKPKQTFDPNRYKRNNDLRTHDYMEYLKSVHEAVVDTSDIARLNDRN